MIGRLFKSFRRGEKGFTLIELLVVVAILGVLAAVAVPNVGKFIGRGTDQAREVELHNIQTGVMAMLADSIAGQLDVSDNNSATNNAVQTGIIDMDLVTADSGAAVLSSYMTGLNSETGHENETKVEGITYTFYEDGTVVQNIVTP